MFFDDEPEALTLKKRAILRVPPPVPDTGWKPPTYFPNLSDATVISFDVERKENDWDHGPGWARGKAQTVGFSLAARDSLGNVGSWYFPIGHAIEPHDNLDRVQCLDYLRSVLSTPNIPKVGANLLYDIGALTDDNIFVQGQLHDCQFAEALIDSDALVALDHLGLKYLGQGKETNLLYEWCARAYGGPASADQRGNIWRAPPRLVGPYGEQDALMPILILEKQFPLMAKEFLTDVYNLECGLIPLLIKMRLQGVTVNIAAAEKLYHELEGDIKTLYAKLYAAAPVNIKSVNSGNDLAKIFDYMGLNYPLTKDGNPSFRKDFLTNCDHPVADIINEIRGTEKVRGTFIRNYILQAHVNGKLFPLFHPMKNDDNGAKTGRFAGSDPNLQNIPIRTPLGVRVRKLFEGPWKKIDYSQIEYRYLAHYAVGQGSDELRAKYNADKKTDYHVTVQNTVKELTGIWIERRPIKNLNFGLVFGMGEGKLARQNNFDKSEATQVFGAYHKANPYVKETAKAIATEAQILGYISTILGRRIRFNYWEPTDRDYSNEERPTPLPYDYAIRRYGSRIKRANVHKAVNYRLQGSGTGDQIKLGMYQCYKQGIFDVTGVPCIQVHDELGMIRIDDNAPAQIEAYRELQHVMETCLPVKVPIFVDIKDGATWGDCD